MSILSEASFRNLSSNFYCFSEFLVHIDSKELLFSNSPAVHAGQERHQQYVSLSSLRYWGQQKAFKLASANSGQWWLQHV
jgi:hypothetical protein